MIATTAHLFKLVWNRKRSNALIMLELFIAFLALYGVTALSLFFWSNYNKPLGFSYANVWQVEIDRKEQGDKPSAEQTERLRRLIRSAQTLSEVENVTASFTVPFSNSGKGGNYTINGKQLRMDINEVTDSFKDVMNLQLTNGRWFNPSDDGQNWIPVIINERLCAAGFGSESPLGKPLYKPEPGEKERRVVGVITDFRKNGELPRPSLFMAERINMNDTASFHVPHNLMLKLRSGTTAAFEETLVKTLQATVKDWSYRITPLQESHDSTLKNVMIPFVLLGLVVGFLLLMVALGLVGIVWQSVTRRTREIGVRRAFGATYGDVHFFVLGELLIITTFALIAGVVLLLQLPLVGFLDLVDASVYAASMVLAMSIMYGITALCGLYPSMLASRIQPSEALRYE